MSDDKPKRDDEPSSSIPPELKPFISQREWPEAELRDEAEVEAVFGPIEAQVAEWQREADKRDAQLGVGNVSAYAGPVLIRDAAKPVGGADEPKVALRIGDTPRALPAGNPNLPTEEINTRALRDAARARPEAAAPTPARAERTVGGNTQKMPVIVAPVAGGNPASPWAKESDTTAVTSSALPSSLGPQATTAHDDDALGSVTPARGPSDGRGRTTGFVVAGALALVVAGVAVRVMTSGTTDGSTTSPAASSAPATSFAPPTATVEPRATSQATPPAPSASTSAAASVQVPAPSAVTARPSERAPAATGPRSDDPYDGAVTPIPAASAAATAPPPSSPPVPPTAPPAPSTIPSLRPSVVPKPVTSANPFDKPNYE
jgi:hypothetical protein